MSTASSDKANEARPKGVKKMDREEKEGQSGGGITEEGQVPTEELDAAVETSGNIQSPTRMLETATAEIWTLAEMEEAEPCDVIEVSDEDLTQSLQAEEERPEPTGRGEGIETGGLPEQAAADEEPEEAIETLGYGYPPPFTRHEVLCPYTIYPYRTIGKLFFKRGGRSYVCSASSIGNYAIWTAGHCLHEGNGQSGGWSTNVVFVPAYRDGSAPYGQWSAKALWVRTAWYKNGIPKGLCQDMGGAILFPKSSKRISQVVGWLGFAWNWSRIQHWHALGYPAASPFNGMRMIETEASYAYNGSVGCSPAPIGIGCDMTGGCSGGPWIWRFGTGNYLNGDNSYRRTTRPEELFSPYFGNHAKSLRDTLVKGTA